MRCKSVERLMPAYLDGELSDARMAQVRTHLTVCERCSRDLLAYRDLQSRLNDLQVDSHSDELYVNLLSALDEERRKPLVRGSFMKKAVVAGIVAGALIGGYGLSIQKNEDRLLSEELAKNTAIEIRREDASLAGADPLAGRGFVYSVSYESR